MTWCGCTAGALPQQRRIQDGGQVKRRVVRPGRLSMWLDDPGTAQVMRQCVAAEEQALSRLGHDFTYAVCSPLAAPAQGRGGLRRLRDVIG